MITCDILPVAMFDIRVIGWMHNNNLYTSLVLNQVRIPEKVAPQKNLTIVKADVFSSKVIS